MSAALKTGKYSCHSCSERPECIHDYIPKRCPCCDHQLVKVSTNGNVFCSNHESICGYEEIQLFKPREEGSK